MNGGDIQFEFIKEADFKSLAPEHREWLLFKGVRSLSFTCHGRPGECEKKYIKRRDLIVVGAVAVGFLVGYGVLQAQVFLPHMVRTAIAAATGGGP